MTTYHQGVLDSAALLDRTAADFLQMAERITLPADRNHFEYPKRMREKTELASKAALLHGQALLVRDMVPAPPAPKCAGCGGTARLVRDYGSGGPWRCQSPDCMVF